MNSKTKKINPDFFCDGPYYVLTSSSLGGSNLTTDEIADKLLQNDDGVKKLLSEGIALPLFFPSDCSLDGCTKFVLGELSELEEKNWIGKITSKLKVPCGKVVLIAGGGDSEYFFKAISGEEQDETYVFYDTFEIPEGDYLVELYCFLGSDNFEVEFDVEMADLFHLDKNEIENKVKYYKENFQPVSENYIFKFTKLEKDPKLPKLVEEIGWCGIFEYR